MISKKWEQKVKLCPITQGKLAVTAGVNPSVLSRILNGATKVNNEDHRVIRIGQLLGLTPDECFTKDNE